MDLFFEIQRQKSHIFCDVKETQSVLELKKIIEGIEKVAPEDQQLHKLDSGKNFNKNCLDETATLQDCGFTPNNAKAQMPATIALCFRKQDGSFEEPCVDELSQPPPLPDVMRQGEGGAPAPLNAAPEPVVANG